MKLLGCTAFSIQLLAGVAIVRASSEPVPHGFADPGATPTGVTNAPSASAYAAEHVCPECMVRLMMPPGESGLNAQQEADVSSHLTAEISRIIDETAAALNKPRAEVFSGLEAVVRARRGGRLHLNLSSLIDPKYSEEGKRLFGRMVELLRKFVSAYVTAVAENGLGSESSSAPLPSAKAESSTSTTEASLPAVATPPATTPLSTAEAKTTSMQHTTSKAASTKSRSRSHSSSDNDDDDDEDDEDDDEDDDRNDDKDKNEQDQGHSSSKKKDND
ncbi:hypothetical protein GGF43_005094 [Coemansia sp. RSA 2618]|nr:hypothetical protein GGF43_005094 [Coemansia sp. RSA 2618]